MTLKKKYKTLFSFSFDLSARKSLLNFFWVRHTPGDVELGRHTWATGQPLAEESRLRFLSLEGVVWGKKGKFSCIFYVKEGSTRYVARA